MKEKYNKERRWLLEILCNECDEKFNEIESVLKEIKEVQPDFYDGRILTLKVLKAFRDKLRKT